VCFPSLSFKDVSSLPLWPPRAVLVLRPSAAATGNLANAVAAQAAQQGFDACVFIPSDLEPAKF